MGVATIIDVAKRAGVSRSTVSLVINKSPLVKDDTRQLVERVIAQMGYVLDEQLLAHVVPASLKALRNARLMPYELTEEQLRHAITAVEHF